MPLPLTTLLLVLAVGLSAGACRGVPTLGASDMVRVPEGEFLAGGGYDYEQSQPIPVEPVYVAEFFIDKFEVTVSAYRACVTSGSCSSSELDVLDGQGIVNAPFAGEGDPFYGPFLPSDTCTWSASGNDALPLNCVTWNEADIFCRWAGKRLPNSLEWEKAARGIDGRDYPWGNTAPTCEFAVLDESGLGCRTGGPIAVGSRPKGASPYGAMDMQGNVGEWVADAVGYWDYWLNWRHWRFWQRDLYPKGHGPKRQLLGGDYSRGADGLFRLADRVADPPEARQKTVGFRCAL